ncbi:MAG: putative cation-transporting ATPase 13A2, partial [Streblomastix strix]
MSTQKNYTKQGLRIIAFAHKQIPLLPYETIDNIQRNECESELQFLGFLILINKLRPASKEVIKRLTDANVQCMMVTGDNILTAVNTARNCGIIPVPANQNLIDGVSSVNQKQNTQQNYHNQDDINMDNYQQLENEQISNSETRSADFDFERQYPVFLGDIDTDGEVEWRCDIYPEWILDPVTLFPKYSPIGLKQQQCNNLIQNTNTIEVYNPFKSWKGGPWGILHFRGGFKLPE